MKVEADLPGNAELLEKYDVKSLPTVVYMRDGMAWGALVGLQPEDKYREWIDRHLDMEAAVAEGRR